jgi:hypothetical protein
MNKQYNSKKTLYDFSTLKNETNYKCSGSQCTCKYLDNRSEYDKNQYLQYQKLNNINYGVNMYQNFKKTGI